MGVYEQLGVRPVINAAGAVTRLGGAQLSEEALAAFAEAAGRSVALDQLQAAAARLIAEVTGAESGLVTAGAASALTLGAAAILCRHDLGRMERLPHIDGAFPDELLIAREQRSGYDHAFRASGARLVEVGMNEIVANAGVRRTEVWEYAAAITPRTAGIVYVRSQTSRPDLKQLVELAHHHRLPVLVDAAGELPPRSNLRDIPATGADLIAFSGGKTIRGPQSTGILCGKRALISSAALQMLDMDDHFELWEPPPDLIDKSLLPGIPRHGIGRAHKVSKEEIVALLTALQAYVRGDYDDDHKRLCQTLHEVVSALKGFSVRCELYAPDDVQTYPHLKLILDKESLPALEVCRRLRTGEPAVHVGQKWLPEGMIVIYPQLVRADEVEPLIRRLREVLAVPAPSATKVL